ncbi:PAS domain S-box protein [Pontibacter sp. H249]|uniref:PAS domain S-box protein n=1 Tax=Pontibacter sp. H249 TaxID=3133420 RepID=UPI0030C0C160
MDIAAKILKYSPDMYCCINRQGYIVKVSDACKNLLGYAPQELEGKVYIDFVAPESRKTSRLEAKKVLQGHQSNGFENIYICKNGNPVSLRWTAQWVEEEQLMFCSARNATALVKARQKANDNYQRYRALFDNNPDVVFLEDLNGKITEVNHAFCNTFALAKEEVIGKVAATFLSPEMAVINQKSFEAALKGNTLRFDLCCQATEKGLITFDVVKFPVVAQGQIQGVQTIAKDITPIVRSFETITKQAQKLNTIFESITDALIMLDKDWKIVLINSTAESILCLNRKANLGKDIREVYPPHKFEHFYSHYTYAMATGKTVHFKAFFQEKSMWMEIKAFPSREGLSIYFNDATEKVKAQQELERLSLVASRTDNGVVITDAAGNTEWINEGFTQLTGYTLPEMQGKKPGALLQGPETNKQTLKLIRKKLKQGIYFNSTLLNYTKAGQKVWISMDITPIRNEDERIVQYVSIQRDITYKKEAEEKQLQMTQDLYRQNRDLQQFTYIVSHNLRAPVANALGLSLYLNKVNKDSPTFDRALTYLHKSITQLDAVLKDINTILSVRESQDVLTSEQVVLKDTFMQACTHLQEVLQSCNAQIEVDIPDKLKFNANHTSLFSIFYNLLSNAIKFRSEKRQLQVHVRVYKKPKGSTVICFRDNGIGFDVVKAGNNVFKLYKKFHHEATSGRGLGLFLVKTHVEVMGGSIDVKSQINKGTEFLIYLP